ncbi:arsenate reductase (glutaredoxin) [Gilvimarinus polysaccharolyticus]|uniref:arsenate reductase (glutaredoxin) n=1 Tax=Gilvimarinus polysaccharolyticus TaxID=863921 RepID=UPI0006739635|nr:arsenate reductase (glutaredoxin) [Gilvimarinus polysaccharolyticus]
MLSIYHNPRCSKSRQTLALLEERGLTPKIIKYLDTPPTPAELKDVLNKLGISARELLRSSEAEYQTLGLADKTLPEAALINAMSEYPKLIERPIVIHGARARLGRPPEQVLDILA